MWLWIASSLAAPRLDPFPWSATVDLEPEGVQRIHVPPLLHDPYEPLTDRNVLLLNGRGEAVPFALLRGNAEPTVTPASPEPDAPVRVEALGDGRYAITVQAQIQSWLRIRFPDAGTYELRATLTDERGDVHDDTLLWSMRGQSYGTLALPPRLGTFVVQLHDLSPDLPEPLFEALRNAAHGVPDEVIEVELDPLGLQENGWARWDVVGDPLYAFHTLTLHVAEPWFDRKAGIITRPVFTRPGALVELRTPQRLQPIRRLRRGGSSVEQTTLLVQEEPPLTVLVESSDEAPLTLLGATGRFPGVHLLVQDPGPGPHTLYAGGPPSRPPAELDFSALELAREAGPLIEPHTPVPNPHFVPPEERSGLTDPGAPFDARHFQWEREVRGAPGLVRIALDDHVIDGTRPDLADLRLLDEEGRQIPYLTVAEPEQRRWGSLRFERVERGHRSVLTVEIPRPNAEIGSIILHTNATVFDRRVTVSRYRGTTLERLRIRRWKGHGGESTPLVLGIHRRVGDRLVIEIENGDDPPLPVEEVRAVVLGWSILASLPASGRATLVYGSPFAEKPQYDIEMLRTALLRRPAPLAALSEPRPHRPPAIGLRDSLLLTFGIGGLTLGLLGMTLLVVREPRALRAHAEECPPPGADPGQDGETAE